MSLKVLIVDDDPVCVMLHRLRVKTSNISENPKSYYNGKTAFDAILEAEKKDDDYLIFLDINMPVMNGWDLLNAIQTSSILNKVHVVMVSSSVDYEDMKKAKTYPQVIGFYEKALNGSVCNEIKSIPALSSFYN